MNFFPIWVLDWLCHLRRRESRRINIARCEIVAADDLLEPNRAVVAILVRGRISMSVQRARLSLWHDFSKKSEAKVKSGLAPALWASFIGLAIGAGAGIVESD